MALFMNDTSNSRRIPRDFGAVPLEKWGGAECTVNRVGDQWFDQLAATGHHDRAEDLTALVGLKLDALRLPILWERVWPDPTQEPDWNWSDHWHGALKRHGVRPIAGLIHHGSGPAGTSLIDPAFAQRLADYAALVAGRYPDILDWTPVNEPLTTARFSALYGIWYPHVRDERLFWTALLNQVDATRLAMRAIRKVIPDARLIQTEDLGRTYATAGLADQAAFDNQRRWMTWDLLCGMVGPDHPLWGRLCGFGLRPRLEAIAADPCPPDVIGINHYLTSDRLLDEQIVDYPDEPAGGNVQSRYCDLAAIRVVAPPPGGLKAAVREAWVRYSRPLALTEVHNGCTREEQVRWFDGAWRMALQARAEGIDLRAVTAWALFGNRGWSTLLTRPEPYEPGAFDVSAGHVRETALAAAIRQPGSGAGLMSGQGWWERDTRLLHRARPRPAAIMEYGLSRAKRGPARRALLIVGATGTLGRALAAECVLRDIPHVLAARAQLDLLDAGTIDATLKELQPWAVINAAGWVRVDDAEGDPAACHAVNHHGALALAQACVNRGVMTVNFSSDLVFDGRLSRPYHEADQPNPLGCYGRSKAGLEQALSELAGDHLVVRTAAFFSPSDNHNFAVQALGALAAGREFAAADDCRISPTYVPDLCRQALDLLLDGETGVWHLTNGTALSWHELALRLAAATGLDPAPLLAIPRSETGWRAPRPANSALTSSRGVLLPTLDHAIERFARDWSGRLDAPRRGALAVSSRCDMGHLASG